MRILDLFKRRNSDEVLEAGSETAMPEPAVADVAPEAPPYQERSHAEIKVIMGALMLAMLLATLDQTIVSTALPAIAVELHGLKELSWVATAYLLTSAIATPIYGKLGDLYGRKKLFQISIIIFLIGSVLCGLSQNMNQLILFRALQGLGGGGLMALILAIIGEIVTVRQRSRYQAYFGAVFAISSVAGPLLGGLFTEHLDWRWIFYINIPLGIVALSAIAARLHLPVRRSPHRVDYAGASLLSAAIVSLLLVCVWGGVEYAWTSATIIGLAAAFVAFAITFVVREHYAKEPIIPLTLFKNDIFVASTALAFLSGIAMFVAILYIPQYQQIVRGNTPTESGLLMLPLVAGILVSSIVSGRIISKTGRYRPMPIIGTLVVTFGMWLFSHLTLTTSHLALSLWMLTIGIGVGMFMQVTTLAVQNATRPEQLGTATSTVTFFRSIGSSLGGAIFGTILTSRLTHHIHEVLPQAGNTVGSALATGTAHIPPEIKAKVLGAYAASFRDMFMLAIPFTLAAFVAALFLREAPLRESPAVVAPEE